MSNPIATLPERPRIGLALGSGSARGWAHIGIIKALAEQGIVPDIVCGASIGAMVGAAYVAGQLDPLEQWVRKLGWREVMALMDVKLGSGVIDGAHVMQTIGRFIPEMPIAQCSLPYAAVATELHSGRECWFQSGSLRTAVRASMALPGLFAPVQSDGHLVVDGGLVNPVPVSLCRALGADMVIAVNLNSGIVGKHFSKGHKPPAPLMDMGRIESVRDLAGQLRGALVDKAQEWLTSVTNGRSHEPGLFEVLATSLNIMQDRITRSRMAGDPPDVTLSPRLAHIGLLEFNRAGETIAEGVACVERAQPALALLQT